MSPQSLLTFIISNIIIYYWVHCILILYMDPQSSREKGWIIAPTACYIQVIVCSGV